MITGGWTGRLAALSAAIVLAGCSAGDVELNGKLFELAGLTGTGERSAPKVAERAPLVVPPDLARLPEPGTANDPGESSLAAINDPDRAAEVNPEELARRQAEFCSKTYDLAKMRGEQDADSIVGPAGPCRQSALSAVGGVGGLFGVSGTNGSAR